MIKDINAITPEYFKYRLEQETEQYKQETEQYKQETEQYKQETEQYKQEIEKLQNQLQQKENIIKEVREFIYKCNDGKQGINYSGCSKLLEILDKEKETGSDKE